MRKQVGSTEGSSPPRLLFFTAATAITLTQLFFTWTAADRYYRLERKPVVEAVQNKSESIETSGTGVTVRIKAKRIPPSEHEPLGEIWIQQPRMAPSDTPG